MAVKKARGLGRGLSSILGGDWNEETSNRSSDTGITDIALTQLQAGRFQPRTQWEMQKLEELADSIREQGVISPIIVRSCGENRYEIIAGERRFRASKMAGKTTIPAIVRSVEDKDALAMALIENMQRADLNALEEAMGVKRLIEEFDYTHEQAAKAIGRSRSATSNLLRLLNLSEPVQHLLMDGKLEMGHARALLSIEGANQVTLAQEAASKGLTVREVEKKVSDLGNPASVSVKKNNRPAKSRDEINYEESLSEALGAPVEISYKKGKTGQIRISFADLDDLQIIGDRILSITKG